MKKNSRETTLKEVFASYFGGTLSDSGYDASEETIAKLMGSKKKLGGYIKKVFQKKNKKDIAKGREKGIPIGLAKGRAEGILEGQKIGMSSLLVHILERKFKTKPLPVWALETIEKASPSKIKQWSVRKTDGKALREFLK